MVRSYLYVPGNAADKLAKAAGRGADALIVDLEDAVPLSMKDDARAAVVAWLRAAPPHDLASPPCSHSHSVIDVIGSVARFRSLSSV